MKLRYYLRGLAVGILLTTLILTIANAQNKPLTDAQIRQKALELGMVDPESVKLSSLQNENAAGSATSAESKAEDRDGSTEAATGSGSNTESSAATGSDASSEAATGSGSSAESSAATGSDASGEAATGSGSSTESSAATGSAASSEAATGSGSSPASAQSEPGDTAGQASGGQAVIIEIKSGATSYTVSRDLAAAGLVDDAKAYDDYLCNNGYATRIHVGVYEIMPGATEEEIARTIAY